MKKILKKVRIIYNLYLIDMIEKELNGNNNQEEEEKKDEDDDEEEYNKEKEREKEKDETEEKIKTIFKKIKTFDQLKREVYEIKKSYEKTCEDIDLIREKFGGTFNKYSKKGKKNGSAITFEQIEEEKNFKNYVNDKLNEIDKKFKFILGDIIINEDEDEEEIGVVKNLSSKDLKNQIKNKTELTKKSKILNLSDVNRRLTQLHLSKMNSNDFETKSELFSKKINEVDTKINELISNLFGVNIENIDFYKVKKQMTFVSKKDFETYKNKNDEEFEKIWEEINKLKKDYEEIIKKSNEGATLGDIKSMKDLILNKTEELFKNLNKKYSNNFATVEILEKQFKKLLELLAIKEEQDKENWLIAKKPMGGYSCASCESFLGDLKSEKNKFVHWNKMPFREREMSGDKFYRVGNGYSRLLQMINFDSNGNVTLNPFVNSSNDINNSSKFSNNNENNKSHEFNKSVSRERNNSSNSKSRSKEGSKENNRTIDITRNRIEENKNNKKLPLIKSSMSSENFEKLSDKTNVNIKIINQNANSGGNNTSLNFKNSKITKVLKKNQF